MVAFWQRKLSEEIVVSFARGRSRSYEVDVETDDNGGFSEDRTPLYEDVPGMLRRFEEQLGPEPEPENQVYDDGVQIAIVKPENPFGSGWVGAMFGAKLHTLTSNSETITQTDPVITDWAQLEKLKFDENNEWLQKILSALRYFVEHASRPFAIGLWELLDGANFVGLMRGTTQLYYDLADRPPELGRLYELGFTSACRAFEMKRDIVKPHNDKVFGHQAYSDMAPGYGLPWTDTDAYTVCSPAVFTEVGLENKQRIIDRFGGGEIFVHGLGQHIVPVVAQLKGLTQFHVFDDPKCPTYFSIRNRIRQQIFDIPLAMDCNLDEFADALSERTLPGGVHYRVFAPKGVKASDLNDLMKRVRQYRTAQFAATPR